MKGSANFTSRSIKTDAMTPECISTLSTTEAALPAEGNNTNGNGPFVAEEGKSTTGEPTGQTGLWIAIAIFAFVGILGAAEGFRRYRVHKSQQGRRRHLQNSREQFL